MPRIEGRQLKKPVIAHMMCGDRIILRIDDRASPETWLTIEFTLEEWVEVSHQYFNWVSHSFGNERLIEAGMVERE